MPRLKAPRRREQLIQVATGLFARLGYDAATTAAIAKDAGITEPVLYRHFASKQAMFVAVVHALSASAMAGWQQILDLPLSPDEQLRLACQHEYKSLRDAPEPYRLFHGVLANGRDEVVLEAVRRHFSQVERLFASLLEAGQRQGVFREDFEPRVMTSLLVSLAIGFAMHDFSIVPGGVSAEEFADFVLRQVRAAGCGEPVAPAAVTTSGRVAGLQPR